MTQNLILKNKLKLFSFIKIVIYMIGDDYSLLITRVYEIIRNKKILELGSGTGLLGISALCNGAAEVMLTDLAYTLDNLNNNIIENSLNDLNIHAALLDWSNSSTYPVDKNWDVIIAADVVWLEELVEPLVKTLRSLSNSDTVIYISHQTRSRHTDDLLFNMLKSCFDIYEVLRQDYHQDFYSQKIKIIKATSKL
jgi:predicted nicotinamide N-methyase